jgi:hypothetical protein
MPWKLIIRSGRSSCLVGRRNDLCKYEPAKRNGMEMPRGTLQRILYSAHKKTAEALCLGREILIDGGHFELSEARCDCKKRCSLCRFSQGEPDPE